MPETTDPRPAAPGPTIAPANAEAMRLSEDQRRFKNWKRWGPYLSERQWGTVREDYSANGDCWNYFPHDHARSRAYRWGEDGLLGITDRECRVCFALALWNEKDPILKERLFGLTGPEGNHGEDVKEHYFYLDSTPTHSYMKALYLYPQRAFPYDEIVAENKRRTRQEPEYELSDTGVFEGSRYFGVYAEYAKAAPDDILIRITVENRGPDTAPLHVLPTVWCRNLWSWGRKVEGGDKKPAIAAAAPGRLGIVHDTLGEFEFAFESGPGGEPPEVLFTENETNRARFGGDANPGPVKDAFHDRLIRGRTEAVSRVPLGTKAAPWYRLSIPAGGRVVLRARLRAKESSPAAAFGASFDETFAQRIREADAYYRPRTPDHPEKRNIARQAFAGLLWSRQFYHFIVKDWLEGDPAMPAPSPERRKGRNADWAHLYNRDVISMPDKWEYPWYAAWDLAFHMIPMSRIDPSFAKEQLLLFLREWYMHPSGQIPAYEFEFSDVNPPVHAGAVFRVYKMTGKPGKRDRDFLARAFQKLLMNFTWWVNRKDPRGNHLFSGGFLGLDNIGVFDRSRPLPTGGHLEQADGTAWMGFYCANMLSIAIELAQEDKAYEDMASKFFEHYVAIIDAMNTLGGTGLWDEQDGFYYDKISLSDQPDGAIPLRVRSLVGVVPLLACLVVEDEQIARLEGFRKRTRWFLENRKDLARYVTLLAHEDGRGDGKPREHALLAIPSRDRLVRVLRYVLDENEFLSPFGIRSLSLVHKDKPYIFRAAGEEYRVDYSPGESTTGLFGGNSNWRGPIWFPLNFLFVEALERFHHFYGGTLLVECPTGSGNMVTLAEVADEIRLRLSRLFLPAGNGERPCMAGDVLLRSDPRFRELLLFHEHFHADSGRGLGAAHQTGWTALIAEVLRDQTCTE